MLRITNKIENDLVQLVFKQKNFFSKMLSRNLSNPIKERVMSTPTWPVPYYTRISKAYPIRGKNLYYSRIKVDEPQSSRFCC